MLKQFVSDFLHSFCCSTENCTWEYRTTECSASCDGGTKVTYTVIIKPAKGDGYCPDFVLRNETTTEECNKQPCGESYNCVAVHLFVTYYLSV